MVAATRSVDEILALVMRREAVMHPQLRGLWAVQGLGALLLALILLVDYFRIGLPFSLDFLAPAGAPLRILLFATLVGEGAAVAHRFATHHEPPYAQLAQSAALTLASAGAIAAGVGLIVFLAWTGLLLHYWPDALWIEALHPLLTLTGAGAILASLPTLAASAIKPLVQHET